MKKKMKELITTIPGIILLFTGVAFLILDVLKIVDFDVWHMALFTGFGLFMIFGDAAGFKAFGNSIVNIFKKKVSK